MDLQCVDKTINKTGSCLLRFPIVIIVVITFTRLQVLEREGCGKVDQKMKLIHFGSIFNCGNSGLYKFGKGDDGLPYKTAVTQVTIQVTFNQLAIAYVSSH